jgi:hypothetical protein
MESKLKETATSPFKMIAALMQVDSSYAERRIIIAAIMEWDG